MQKMMGLMRKCIDDYHMISPGDKIAVGVSGGKDSLTLLTVLAALRSYYPAPFELTAITIDMGLGGMDFSPVEALLGARNEPSDVAAVHEKHQQARENAERNENRVARKDRRHCRDGD